MTPAAAQSAVLTKDQAAAGAAYDTALVFTHGAQALQDAAKTLEALASRPADPKAQQEIQQLQQKILVLHNQLSETSQRLAEAIRASNGRERMRR